jgi:hypothetical protein
MKRLLYGLSALMLVVAACGGTNNTTQDSGTPDSGQDSGQIDSGQLDSGQPDSGVDAGPTLRSDNCWINPETNDQIINACTDAGFIDTDASVPLNPDGGLPAIP